MPIPLGKPPGVFSLSESDWQAAVYLPIAVKIFFLHWPLFPLSD
ncbi:hypothetical protein STRDD11_02696 [Streptococcus sp. DD11]|nr:hypothetical protein STRDD11_02696 [Streptococcus sp. DD11]